MKTTLLILLSITLSSCGKGPHTDANDSVGVTLTENLVSSCSVTKDTETLEIVISCPDGSEERLKDGVDGQDGTSCTIEDVVGGAMITCAGTSVFIKDGVDGQDGSACSVVETQNSSGSLISCADGTTAFIRNGQDGADGQDGEDGSDGQDGLDFVQRVIDPCGQETTHGLDEVLLILQSGDILAHYYDGQNQYLTILKRNKQYVTSDGTNCKFKVTKDGGIKY